MGGGAVERLVDRLHRLLLRSPSPSSSSSSPYRPFAQAWLQWGQSRVSAVARRAWWQARWMLVSFCGEQHQQQPQRHPFITRVEDPMMVELSCADGRLSEWMLRQLKVTNPATTLADQLRRFVPWLHHLSARALFRQGQEAHLRELLLLIKTRLTPAMLQRDTELSTVVQWLTGDGACSLSSSVVAGSVGDVAKGDPNDDNDDDTWELWAADAADEWSYDHFATSGLLDLSMPVPWSFRAWEHVSSIEHCLAACLPHVDEQQTSAAIGGSILRFPVYRFRFVTWIAELMRDDSDSHISAPMVHYLLAVMAHCSTKKTVSNRALYQRCNRLLHDLVAPGMWQHRVRRSATWYGFGAHVMTWLPAYDDQLWLRIWQLHFGVSCLPHHVSHDLTTSAGPSRRSNFDEWLFVDANRPLLLKRLSSQSSPFADSLRSLLEQTAAMPMLTASAAVNRRQRLSLSMKPANPHPAFARWQQQQTALQRWRSVLSHDTTQQQPQPQCPVPVATVPITTTAAPPVVAVSKPIATVPALMTTTTAATTMTVPTTVLSKTAANRAVVTGPLALDSLLDLNDPNSMDDLPPLSIDDMNFSLDDDTALSLLPIQTS